MFVNCYSLISIDVSNFNTSSLTNLGTMFCNCTSLKSIDLSNFDTSNVQYMDNLFNGCKNLTYLNLSNFDTSNVIYMHNMFKGCSSLIYLDFQNFDMSRISEDGKRENMFENCKNLEYINMKNYKPSNLGNKYLFNGCPKNLVVYTENSDFITQIEEKECNVVNCSDKWYESQKKLNTETNNCTDDCSFVDYKFEYNSKCYNNCLKGTYNINNKCFQCHEDCEECDGPKDNFTTNCISCSNNNKLLYLGNCLDKCPTNSYFLDNLGRITCKCELPQCFTCTKESIEKNLCTSCNNEEGYYLVNDNNNYYPYLNCSKLLEGFYLNNDTLSLNLCYDTCKQCNKSGDDSEHNCIECKYDYNYEIQFDVYKNCYRNCSHYYYINKINNKSYCTDGNNCPINYEKLIPNEKQCISFCYEDDYYKYEFRNNCYNQCPFNLSFPGNEYFCKPKCNETHPFEFISFKML